MWKNPARTISIAALVAVLPALASAQDAKRVIDDASKVMGVAGMNAITYSGTVAQGNFGQSRTISFGLASTSIRNYTRTIDFTQPASHATGQAVPPPARGGGPPPQPAPFDQLIASDSPWVQQFSIWVTPWGFLKGAAANNATVSYTHLTLPTICSV